MSIKPTIAAAIFLYMVAGGAQNNEINFTSVGELNGVLSSQAANLES
jgi:hypothetical protein